jgi:hypothetical protein
MKTLTELSGITIRKAAAAIAEAKKSLPPAEAVAPAVAEAPAGEVPAEGAPQAAAPAAAGESEAVKAALDAAASAASGLSGDRLARLREAVEVVGGRLEDVRLVRVFGAEEPVPGAKTVNGFQYLVDLAPAKMQQNTAPKKEKRGGRGGPGGGGGSGGGGGKGAPTSGGFSMDSLREDRKGSRGGPGGGRGRPGGGSPR